MAVLVATDLPENARISAMSKKKKNKPAAAAKSKTTATDSADPADSTTAETPVSTKGLKRGYREPVFAQYFSFVLLLIVIVLVSVMFYEVMASFWIPLFLAAVLVVVFRPWYEWIRDRFKLGNAIAALLTSISVLLIVLVPLGMLLGLAVVESQQVLRQFNSAQALENAEQIRTKLGLELPMAVTHAQTEIENLSSGGALDAETQKRHQASLYEIQYSTGKLADFWDLKRPAATANAPDVDPQTPTNPADTEPDDDSQRSTSPTWQNYLDKLATVTQLHETIIWTDDQPSPLDLPTADAILANDPQQRLATLHEYKLQLGELDLAFDKFIVKQLGGKTRAWAATLLNPTEEQSEIYIQKVTHRLRDTLFVFGGKGLTYILLMIAGSIVMIVSFYFFLLDGHSMINAFKRLSPLDDEHEQELVDQFSKVSRAVVVATLLSAIVQGLLAGIGFYFADLESIFLLTVLSAVLAMVPFLGAASVWIPCALYLYFINNNLTAAIGLAIYGAAVVSMADNIIKPLVLHGQSKLHPLFAFLSVIGGVATLGPIGILIGPMIVAFLQTLLEILHGEVRELEKTAAISTDSPSGQ